MSEYKRLLITNMLKRILPLFILACLYGCDVPAKIQIRNESSGKAVYRYQMADTTTTIRTIEIPNTPGQNQTDIMFGFGQLWTDERITEYVSSINKIEVISVTDTISISDKKEMYQFFRKRRKGLFKDIVLIEIK